MARARCVIARQTMLFSIERTRPLALTRRNLQLAACNLQIQSARGSASGSGGCRQHAPRALVAPLGRLARACVSTRRRLSKRLIGAPLRRVVINAAAATTTSGRRLARSHSAKLATGSLPIDARRKVAARKQTSERVSADNERSTANFLED